MVLPHLDLPIFKPLIPWGSKGSLQRLLKFSLNFLLPFYIYHFLFSPYMYCSKCRRITGTEDITTAASKNGRPMRRSQCIACGKTKIQFVKRGAAGGSFLNTLVNKLPFEMHFPGHNFTGSGTKLYKALNSDGPLSKIWWY